MKYFPLLLCLTSCSTPVVPERPPIVPPNITIEVKGGDITWATPPSLPERRQHPDYEEIIYNRRPVYKTDLPKVYAPTRPIYPSQRPDYIPQEPLEHPSYYQEK